MGIHAAADAFYDWPWYGKLIGAYFLSHPKIQTATLHIENSNHPATRELPKIWLHKDEWYNFKTISPHIDVLITIDEKSYIGGQNGHHHPVAWSQNFEGGRIFYTALGHTAATYWDEHFTNHLLGGLNWVMKR